MLWLARDGRATIPAGVREPGAAFVAATEALRARVLKARKAIDALPTKGPIEALSVARAIEAEPFAPAMLAIDELARALRAPLGLGAAKSPTTGLARPAATGALGAAPSASAPRGGFLDRLKRLGEPAAVEALPAHSPPSPSGARQAFEAAFELVSGVLSYVGPRLQVVDVAIEATGLPARKQPWGAVERALPALAETGGVPEPARPWLSPMAKLIHTDMAALQKAHGAVVQWRETRALHAEAERLRGPEASRDAGEARIAAFDLGRYRAAVYPISHLHLTFKGLSPLSDFFPAP